MNTLDLSLGEIARDVPGATAIFHRYQLNFCCGGKQSLRDAARRRNLDPQKIASELDGVADTAPQAVDFSESSNDVLIEHILTHYHDVHRTQLPELIRLASRVELVHGGHPDCPSGLSYLLEQLQDSLLDHMRKEEQILFPMIIRGMQGMALRPVGIMREEHDEHGKVLAKIRQLTHELTLPEDACNTWAALYLGLEKLRLDLMNHIHLENNVLFERIDG